MVLMAERDSRQGRDRFKPKGSSDGQELTCSISKASESITRSNTRIFAALLVFLLALRKQSQARPSPPHRRSSQSGSAAVTLLEIKTLQRVTTPAAPELTDRS
jgi:hypothetical protein